MVPLTCTPVKGSVHVIGPEAKGALEDLPSSSAWHAAPSAQANELLRCDSDFRSPYGLGAMARGLGSKTAGMLCPR